ncbi:MAG TPA: CHASE4 domain-containing protein [Candidatus Aminicenantes bacterium]|nr:CHASE4 domain-containing protein [Candidatus Aminicenantes bacterium]
MQTDLERQKREQIAAILSLLGNPQEIMVHDYTFWDDLVDYCRRPDPVWARENLDAALKSYHIDAGWMLNLAGAWVYVNDGLSAGQRQSLPMADPAKMSRLFAGNRKLVHFFHWQGGELYEIRGGTVHPTADPDRRTAPQGYLFCGKRWSGGFQHELQQLIDGRIRLLFAGEAPPPPLADRRRGEYQILLDLPGWDGRPVAQVLARGEFSMLASLRRQAQIDLIRGAVLSLLLLALLTLVLNRWLHAPLNRLARALAEEDPARLDMLRKRNDEFGAMAEVTTRFFEQRQELAGQARKVRNLLDHTGQGILSIGPDLRVNPEASRECARLFARTVEGVPFAELLYPDDPREAAVLEKILTRAYSGDVRLRELVLPLLPSEVSLRGLHLSLAFRWILFGDGREGLMVMVTDVTDRMALQGQMAEERKQLRRVVKIVSHLSDFTGLLAEFRSFVECEPLDLSGMDPADRANLFRTVHTFKASFSMFEMDGVVERLDLLEKAIRDRLRPDAAAGGPASWPQALQGSLTEELARVRCLLPGEPWSTRQGEVRVSEGRLDELARQAALLSPGAAGARLAEEIRRLRSRSLREMLSLYPDYASALAIRLGKSVRPFVPEGEDVLVDARHFGPSIKALIHAVRNAVDHGIEAPDGRVAAGKDETGTISLRFDREDGGVRLTLQDDGVGLDPVELRRRGAELGLPVGGEDREALELIWRDGFSTRRSPGLLSGGGEGLSALRRAVAEAGGKTGVRSTLGLGTELWIWLPLTPPEPPSNHSGEAFP